MEVLVRGWIGKTGDTHASTLRWAQVSWDGRIDVERGGNLGLTISERLGILMDSWWGWK